MSGHVEIDAIAPGYTDLGSKVGDIIVVRPVTEWANNIFNVLSAAHNDDGTLKASAVTTTSLGSTVVTAPKIDFGGAGVGVWWEEIGRTTLGTAGDLVTVNFAARKYLKIVIRYSSVTNGTTPYLKFNNIGTTTYAFRTWDGTTNSGFSGQPDIALATGLITAPDIFYAEIGVTNLSGSSKTVISNGLHMNSTAAFAPAIDNIWAMWENTAQVTRVDLFNKSGTGDFAIGAEVIVLGHN
jgi:hypothetical protein